MLTVAYITNEFPSSLEPYVVEEILELRKRGVQIIACSVRQVGGTLGESRPTALDTIYLQPIRLALGFRAAWLCLRRFPVLTGLLHEVVKQNDEPFSRRVRALAHTLLGAYYSLLLRGREVGHIHVHHGYFASWIAMTAARLQGITFSMTLHGSDLLLHHAFLGLKLKSCKFCLTVSEFNQQYILSHYPDTPPQKVVLQRMGVDVLGVMHEPALIRHTDTGLIMLSVGRLHAVKDHAFLLWACKQLKNRGVQFICLIAGDGPERSALGKLVRDLELQDYVTLLGHLPRAKLDAYYSICDLVVLTSRSEGVPLVLMEAMAHGRIVLAPAITGIPELVKDGKTGFLYRPGSLEDFVSKVEAISQAQPALSAIRRRARRHVLEHFNRSRNLAAFADLFPALVADAAETNHHENSVLQQI